MADTTWPEPRPTALLVLADGTASRAMGIGAVGHAVGEVCFNTAMTGYQEILTDPSYAGQIITFTFPHIGNVGTNDEDIETVNMAARSGVRGCVLKADITNPSNYRAARQLDAWLKKRNIIGIAGIDTRALTARIREKRHAQRRHRPCARRLFPRALDRHRAQGLPRPRRPRPRQGSHHRPDLRLGPDAWAWEQGLRHAGRAASFHIVAIDYGAKRNILRCLADAGLPGHRRARDRDRRGHPRRTIPTASSCPTARAIRRRPASMPCRRSRR